MSRLARQPIPVAEGVSVQEANDRVSIKGPKGELNLELLSDVSIKVDETGVQVENTGAGKQASANVGTMWSLIRNAITGVSEGFSKVLEIEGVGYKAVLEGKTLVLSLGFSKPIRYEPAEGISVAIDKNVVTVSGISKEVVGQTAAEIRAFRKPEPYKGKGIHYRGEFIRRKVGKKAATAASG